MTGPLPPSALRERVLAAARAMPASPRGSGVREQRLALLLGFLILGAIWVRLGVHPGTRPLAYIATLATAWLFVAIGATWWGVGRGGSMLGRPAEWRAGVAVFTPVVMLALWSLIARAWPSTLERESGWFAVAQCVVGTGLLGIGPLLAFLFVHRGTEPVRPGLSGAAFGAAAGGWGAAALVIICRHASASHMILGHIVPVVLLVLLGGAIGSRALAIRLEDD